MKKKNHSLILFLEGGSMILNTGNRTDIPGYYSEWFMNRIREGFVYTRNPYYPELVTKYSLSPKVVDIIQFCTKNPIPMLKHLDELAAYRMVWQVTITPYGKEIEPHVPNKNRIIDAIKVLSSKVGKQAIAWRYDPIFINEKYTVDYHIHIFEEMCKRLSPYIDQCIFSYIDLYKKTVRNFPGVQEVSLSDKKKIAKAFKSIADRYHVRLRTCLENDDFLIDYNIDVSGCSTKEEMEHFTGLHLHWPTGLDNARERCRCILGNDIGSYNTCGHGCLYCYANDDMMQVKRNMRHHDPKSPILVGHIKKVDHIREAKQESFIDKQMTIFDY